MWRRRTARWLTTRQGRLDLALVAAVLVVGAVAIALTAGGGRGRGTTHLVLLSLTLVENAVALLFRRRHPVGALVSVLAVYAVFDPPPVMVLPVLVALSTVAALRSGRVLAVVVVVTVAAVLGRPYVHGDPVDLTGQQLPLLAALAVAVAVGVCLRRLSPSPLAGEGSVPAPVATASSGWLLPHPALPRRGGGKGDG
jgi:hypothetical protein